MLAAEVRGTLVAGPVCAAAAAARTALSSPPGSSGGARHLSCAATGAGPGPGHGHQCSTFTWTQEGEEEASYFLWTHTHIDNMFLSGITGHRAHKTGDLCLSGDGLASGVVLVSHQSHDELLHHEYEAVVLLPHELPVVPPTRLNGFISDDNVYVTICVVWWWWGWWWWYVCVPRG